jgi:hypothetical protein
MAAMVRFVVWICSKFEKAEFEHFLRSSSHGSPGYEKKPIHGETGKTESPTQS